MPRRRSKRASVGCAPWHDSGTSGQPQTPRSCAAIAMPSAVPSPPRAPHPWPLRGLRCTTGSAPSRRVWSAAHKGGGPKPRVRLQTLLHRGLTETASLWPEVRVASRGVHQAAHRLPNEEQRPGAAVKRRLGGLLGARTRHRAGAGALSPAVAHFLKVSRSSWPGLFQCYDSPDLPRPNNDLEQCFGAYRSHERRATGRTGASPALVRRGSVQLIAARATRRGACAAWELAPEEGTEWKSLRHALDARRQRRTLRRRFRRDPASSLAELETALLKLTWPP